MQRRELSWPVGGQGKVPGEGGFRAGEGWARRCGSIFQGADNGTMVVGLKKREQWVGKQERWPGPWSQNLWKPESGLCWKFWDAIEGGQGRATEVKVGGAERLLPHSTWHQGNQTWGGFSVSLPVEELRRDIYTLFLLPWVGKHHGRVRK